MTLISDTLSSNSGKVIENCKLSQLLQTGKDCDCRGWPTEPFVSREQWSFVLGINLSQLLIGDDDCDCREWFTEPFVNREQWSFILGIDRATLYRWQKVITSDSLLNRLYKSSNSSRLTAHQGAVLAVFGRLKTSHTYSEVIEKFKSPFSGKPLWWWITKEKFEEWRYEQ